jgi:prophage regulatory protein
MATILSDDLHITRQRDVPGQLGVTQMTVYRLRRDDPTFPTAIRLGPHAVGFFTHELRAWAESRRLTRAESATMAPRTKTGERVIRRPDRAR